MGVPDTDRWNVNIHYHGLLEEAVRGSTSILDVGCGEGMLARRLRASVPRVTGVDSHVPSIESARAQSPSGDIDYVCADFLEHPFPDASFDGIVSVATVHHMDTSVALTRMKDLLRPGGTLAVIGLARNHIPADLPAAIVSFPVLLGVRAVRRQWAHPSPIVWPPPLTFHETRRVAERTLPGATFRRHLLPRYSIVWTKP